MIRSGEGREMAAALLAVNVGARKVIPRASLEAYLRGDTFAPLAGRQT